MNYKLEIHKYAPEMNKLHVIRNDRTIVLNIPGCTDIKQAKKYLNWDKTFNAGFTRVKFTRTVTPKNTDIEQYTRTLSGVLCSHKSRYALLSDMKQPLEDEVYTAKHEIKFF